MVEDTDEAVRYDATLALGELGDTRAVPFLEELALRVNREDSRLGAALSARDKLAGGEPDWTRFIACAWYEELSDVREDIHTLEDGEPLDAPRRLEPTDTRREPVRNDVTMTTPKTALMWFRRDLRLTDNTALYPALRENDRVIGVFVLDDAILKARDIGAARAAFLFGSLDSLNAEFEKHGGRLILRRGGPPERELRALARGSRRDGAVL